ncbi:hypothetical protein BDY24DRAFT_390738 [Mrakia frigida]|uniref:uncharacterized protein n=1 Tax=Mrakia frigida TaxID=29902 RepID=UPI003FCC080B
MDVGSDQDPSRRRRDRRKGIARSRGKGSHLVGWEESWDSRVLRTGGSREGEGQGGEAAEEGGRERAVRDVHVRSVKFAGRVGRHDPNPTRLAAGVLCVRNDRYVRQDAPGAGERGGLDAVGGRVGECWGVVGGTRGGSPRHQTPKHPPHLFPPSSPHRLRFFPPSSFLLHHLISHRSRLPNNRHNPLRLARDAPPPGNGLLPVGRLLPRRVSVRCPLRDGTLQGSERE